MGASPLQILIFGATRGTGLETARSLLATDHKVTAFVRDTSDTTELDALGAKLICGDLFDTQQVTAAIETSQCKAIVLSLSGKRGDTRRADLEGVKTIIDAALAAGVTRILMLTAIGAGDSRSAVAPKVIEILGEVLAAKTEAEDYLVNSGADFTILRPGGLTDNPASGSAIKTTDHSVMGVANRADVGSLTAECVNDSATIGQIYHTVDPEITWQAPLQRGKDLPAGKH